DVLGIQPVGRERRRQRLDPQLVLAGAAGDPRLLDIGNRLEPRLDLARDQIDLRHIRARDADVGRRSAERTAGAAAPSAGPAAVAAAVEIRGPDLDVVEAFDGPPHLFADAARARGAGIARVPVEMHGQRAADFLERAFDELDAVEAEHRLLDSVEDDAGRV